MADKYRPGDHYVTDDITGLKERRSMCRKTWDNYITRSFDPRQPQDFVRGIREQIAVDDPRPQWETDTFLDTNEVTADSL